MVANETAKKLILSSTDFVLNDLNRTRDGNSICFSYSPFDKENVYNANMKAVRILSQGYSITKNNELITEAEKAVKFVIDRQNADGSWFYSDLISDEYIDNYHTGYILDCLKDFIELTGNVTVKKNLEKSYNFYVSNFFENGRIPKFFNNKTYPVDSTSAAQSVITLCNFGNIKLASDVAEYMIGNMQSESGHFYFRRYNYFSNRSSFMRWSNAWMFAALSYLISYQLSR